MSICNWLYPAASAFSYAKPNRLQLAAIGPQQTKDIWKSVFAVREPASFKNNKYCVIQSIKMPKYDAFGQIIVRPWEQRHKMRSRPAHPTAARIGGGGGKRGVKEPHGMCKINTIYDMNIKVTVHNLCRKPLSKRNTWQNWSSLRNGFIALFAHCSLHVLLPFTLRPAIERRV